MMELESRNGNGMGGISPRGLDLQVETRIQHPLSQDRSCPEEAGEHNSPASFLSTHTVFPTHPYYHSITPLTYPPPVMELRPQDLSFTPPPATCTPYPPAPNPGRELMSPEHSTPHTYRARIRARQPPPSPWQPGA